MKLTLFVAFVIILFWSAFLFGASYLAKSWIIKTLKLCPACPTLPSNSVDTPNPVFSLESTNFSSTGWKDSVSNTVGVVSKTSRKEYKNYNSVLFTQSDNSKVSFPFDVVSNMNITNQMSIEVWCKPRVFENYTGIVSQTTSQSPYGGWMMNTGSGSKYNVAGNPINAFDFGININGTWVTWYRSGTSFAAVSQDGLVVDKWYHVVGTYDASGILTMFVNGNVISTQSDLPIWGGTVPLSPAERKIQYQSMTASLNIGSNCDQSFFDGEVGLCQVYKVALSAQEVFTKYSISRTIYDSISI